MPAKKSWIDVDFIEIQQIDEISVLAVILRNGDSVLWISRGAGV